jgi:hypothetical protein
MSKRDKASDEAADKAWQEAFARGATRAKQRQYLIEGIKGSKKPPQLMTHDDMRSELKGKTETAVACLEELQISHAASGHFENNMYIPPGVSRRDVELAFRKTPEDKK